ncbi:hypothetical protein C8R42DRAFT_9701 [Lentinula raphanica]|nr:hypothetical protein C8R42DRAFT_9701 [Lentinula raphanica]
MAFLVISTEFHAIMLSLSFFLLSPSLVSLSTPTLTEGYYDLVVVELLFTSIVTMMISFAFMCVFLFPCSSNSGSSFIALLGRCRFSIDEPHPSGLTDLLRHSTSITSTFAVLHSALVHIPRVTWRVGSFWGMAVCVLDGVLISLAKAIRHDAPGYHSASDEERGIQL